ncbi:family 16 glycosylhydrolase [Tolumonas lignilytica]|uniref:family 16 glycosylhydrolase n=1 Tax=Tolumonas lignilytica TaxID=1283284 RepID=UPI0004644618|nr:family 16 glycosylhydrolase [Tolumonas lignilytica]
MSRITGVVSAILLTGSLYTNQAAAWEWSNIDWQLSDGWRNGGSEFDCTWRAANVWMESNLAILNAKSENGNKSCAEMRTYNYTRRGRYEVQMQAGAVPGTISSFFTYTGEAGTSTHYEVDIELMGGTNLLHTNVWIQGQQYPQDINLGQYGMAIWNMERYAFNIDEAGVTWQVFSRTANKWVTVRRADKPVTSYMQLFVNNWISANPTFPPSNYNGLPAYAKYASVVVTPWE